MQREQKPKLKLNENDILEQSRSAALESAADLLESIAHAQKLKKRAESTFEDRRDPGDKDTESGDFLFDMLRLNAHYLNELAKLGRRHNAVAHRALENFYALVNPAMKNPSSKELEFSREKPMASFAVQNDVNPDPKAKYVMVEWETIEHPRTGDPYNPFVIELERRMLSAEIEGKLCRVVLELPFGIPKVVTLHVHFDELLERRYRLELQVRLRLDDEGRDQVRRIPIVIDAREKHSDE